MLPILGRSILISIPNGMQYYFAGVDTIAIYWRNHIVLRKNVIVVNAIFNQALYLEAHIHLFTKYHMTNVARMASLINIEALSKKNSHKSNVIHC